MTNKIKIMYIINKIFHILQAEKIETKQFTIKKTQIKINFYLLVKIEGY